MNDLTFRGKDRYWPSWPEFTVLGLVLVGLGVYAYFSFGIVFAGWMLGGCAVLAGLVIWMSLRSRTAVGAAGITICRSFMPGRTYSWQEIRRVDVCEFKGRSGTYLMVGITLVDGRLRTLPSLHHSRTHFNPNFYGDFRQIVKWWKLSTDPASGVCRTLR